MRVIRNGIWTVVAAALIGAPQVSAAPSVPLTGSIAGVVQNAFGIPQMGATVSLFNRLEKQIARVMTDDRGVFEFDSLPSDMYTLRVTLMTFLPAIRSNISVQPGIRRVFAINVAGMLSSIEFVYSLPVGKAMMSEDWKWTLRGTAATRPILRVLASDAKDPLKQYRSSIFKDTRGIVKLSAGDAAPAALGSQPDLGTAFALATSFLGNNVEVSGNVGYGSQSGNPTAGFRTSFSRSFGEGRTPEVSVTMRQIFLAGRAGSTLMNSSDSVPTLRTISIGMTDRAQILENTVLTYGATMESVQFLQRLSFVSPFARLTHNMEELGVVEFGYSSGLPPMQLYAQANPDGEQRDSSTWAMFPRVSLRDSKAHIQRTQNYEMGYRKKLGSRTVSLGAYREVVSNAALTAVDAEGALASSDLLPDLFSTASILNAGRFTTTGYMASAQQTLGQGWTATVAYGNSGVLEARQEQLVGKDASSLRDALHVRRRQWATTQLAGVVPGVGTKFVTSYQFMAGRSLAPGHYYMTQSIMPGQGLNVQVRQPLPGMGGRQGKLEMTADIRNVLGQGYQPITLSDGRRMLLVPAPRMLRGGLAFIF